MTPAISVVVVTFNHAPFIAAALDGVFMQSPEVPLEVIVSDDASADDTVRLVAAHAARAGAPPVRVLRSARNLNSNAVTVRAIEAARGDYIAVMDGDDFWTSPDKLARQRRYLEEHADCAVCFHDQTVTDAAGTPLGPDDAHRDTPLLTTLDDILVGNYVPGSSPLFRRTALMPLPAWVAAAPYGDWALLIAAARHGRIGRIPEVLGAYRRHPGGAWSSLTAQERAEGLVSFYDFLEPHIWEDRRDLVRHVRAGWRANLVRTLADVGAWSSIPGAVERGVRAGDVARVVRAGGVSGSGVAGGGLSLALVEPQPDDGIQCGSVDECRWRDGRTVEVIGWAPFDDHEVWPTLTVECAAPTLGVIAVRLTRTDVAEQVAPSCRRRGFWVRATADEVLSAPLRLRVGGRVVGAWIAPS